MLYISDRDEIQRMLIARTSLEQELSLALSAEFNSGELASRLKVAVWAALLFLKGLKESEPVLRAEIGRLENGNKFLFHTAAKTVEAVVDGLVAGEPLTPAQCGNLIRFYGEVVESCAAMSTYWTAERAKQISFRYGQGGEAFKASRDPTYVAQANQGSVWQTTQTNKTEWSGQEHTITGGRIRTKVKGSAEADFFASGAKPYYDLIPGNLFRTDALKRVNLGKEAGGVMVWRITDASTIGKIDRTFGLPYGADISGTTTDNLYFLTGWADINSADPLLMMLPLAAIVGEYHHSLLEVAGAMSLRRVISYSIGYYTTLLPALPAGMEASSQRASVLAILQRFENDPRNRRVLVHYVNHAIAGCFVMEGPELEAFKRLAKIDMRLWPKFGAMGSFPTEDDLMRLLGEEGLSNAAIASRRGALRRTYG